jgi:hypothetical protein
VRTLRRLAQTQAVAVREDIKDTFMRIRATLLASSGNQWGQGDQEKVIKLVNHMCWFLLEHAISLACKVEQIINKVLYGKWEHIWIRLGVPGTIFSKAYKITKFHNL